MHTIGPLISKSWSPFIWECSLPLLMDGIWISRSTQSSTFRGNSYIFACKWSVSDFALGYMLVLQKQHKSTVYSLKPDFEGHCKSIWENHWWSLHPEVIMTNWGATKKMKATFKLPSFYILLFHKSSTYTAQHTGQTKARLHSVRKDESLNKHS